MRAQAAGKGTTRTYGSGHRRGQRQKGRAQSTSTLSETGFGPPDQGAFKNQKFPGCQRLPPQVSEGEFGGAGAGRAAPWDFISDLGPLAWL